MLRSNYIWQHFSPCDLQFFQYKRRNRHDRQESFIAMLGKSNRASLLERVQIAFLFSRVMIWRQICSCSNMRSIFFVTSRWGARSVLSGRSLWAAWGQTLLQEIAEWVVCVMGAEQLVAPSLHWLPISFQYMQWVCRCWLWPLQFAKSLGT